MIRYVLIYSETTPITCHVWGGDMGLRKLKRVRPDGVIVKTGMTETKCETKRNDETSSLYAAVDSVACVGPLAASACLVLTIKSLPHG